MATSTAPRHDSKLNGSGCSVLVVNEHKAGLQRLPETLRHDLPGVRLELCDCRHSALERLRTGRYHAVMSDLKMPAHGSVRGSIRGEDGDALSLVREVKRERPSLPVLVIGGRTEYSLISKALEAGAYDVIRRPIDPEEAALVIKRALETYELRAYCERQDVLAGRLSQQLRQLHLILRPLLLSSLKALGRELGDERIEQTRTLIETAVSICATQTAVVRRRLEFIEAIQERAQHQPDNST